jgi:hypothetical protein
VFGELQQIRGRDIGQDGLPYCRAVHVIGIRNYAATEYAVSLVVADISGLLWTARAGILLRPLACNDLHKAHAIFYSVD